MGNECHWSIIAADGTTFDLDAKDFIVDDGIPGGAGLPPIQHDARELSGLPGAVLQGISVKPRVIQLIATLNGKCRSELHEIRAKLWNTLRWNRTTDDPPQYARLRYHQEGAAADLRVYYLDDAWEAQTHANGKDGFRLIAYDPYWYGTTDVETAITPLNRILSVNYIMGKESGVWSAFGIPAMTDPGSGISVRALALSNDGNTLYVGGDFLNLNGIANADYIAAYNLVTGVWSALGTGANGMVRTIAVALNDDVYIGGEFNAVGGVANTESIARWDGAVWNEVGGGISGLVKAIVIDSSGNLYIGGQFTNHSDANGDYITKWNGSAYSSLGTGMNGIVEALIIGPDGTLYAGGQFTLAGGVSGTVQIAKWSGSAWSALGSGMSGGVPYVFALAIGPDGMLYAGGNFTTLNRIARWNGAAWSGLGSGVGSTVYSLAFDANGMLYAGGTFTSAGGVTLADRIASWNGTSWLQLAIDLPGTPAVYAILTSDNDLAHLGFDTTGTATVAISTDVLMSGDAESFPTFTITGPGTLQWMENVDTGKRIIFNLYINAGETVTMDLSPGVKTLISDWRGNLFPYATVLPLSDFGNFSLVGAPVAASGNNTILVMMTGTTGASAMTCTHRNAYLSLDKAVE